MTRNGSNGDAGAGRVPDNTSQIPEIDLSHVHDDINFDSFDRNASGLNTYLTQQSVEQHFGKAFFKSDNNLPGSEHIFLAQAPEMRMDRNSTHAPEVWYHRPVEEAQKLMHQAESLTEKHKMSPYSIEASPRNYPKCNIFVYDVMEAAGVPMPHKTDGQKLTVHPLNQALSKDERFEKVWSRDSNEANWGKEKSRFLNTFKPKDGDIAIWANSHLVHTGILEETLDGYGNTYYAGRDVKSGLGHGYLKDDWVLSRTKGYGAPDAIYRYKNFTH